MIGFRTIGQFTKLAVIPEIDRRLSEGILTEADLPLTVHRFRFIQKKLNGGELEPIVELNDEVKLIAETRVKRSVEKGEPLTLEDIEPDEVFLKPPVYEGKQAAFFLCVSGFLNFYSLFDFSPNGPDFQDEDEPSKVRYPIKEIAQTRELEQLINPVEKYTELATANWPPAPGYYPHVLIFTHTNPEEIGSHEFVDIVSKSYGQDFWNERIEFWKETDFFSRRLKYLEKSKDEHFDGDYIASINILVPQFEGIVKDYLSVCGESPRYRFESCVRQLKELVLSRKVLMFPRPLVDLVFDFIEKGSFLRETSQILSPSEEVNRHGIAHGKFVDFETADISLKYLVLLDSLAFVLLHDRIVTDSL